MSNWYSTTLGTSTRMSLPNTQARNTWAHPEHTWRFVTFNSPFKLKRHLRFRRFTDLVQISASAPSHLWSTVPASCQAGPQLLFDFTWIKVSYFREITRRKITTKSWHLMDFLNFLLMEKIPPNLQSKIWYLFCALGWKSKISSTFVNTENGPQTYTNLQKLHVTPSGWAL